MATQFFGRNAQGETREVGVRFWGGPERGTTFQFARGASEGFAEAFTAETGEEFTREEFFQVVQACETQEWER